MTDLSSSQRHTAESLARDLEDVFGTRLRALVAYVGTHGDGSVHSCAIVEGLGFQDLARCLPFTDRWHQRRAAVPLLLAPDELERTLDIFPLEYAAIAADHVVVRGTDPFAGVVIPREHVRRATEAQVKSHVIHLREGYLESRGESARIGRVVAASAGPLRALLINIARLAAATPAMPDDAELAALTERLTGAPAAVIREVLATSAAGPSSVTDPSHLLSRYIDAAQKIWEYVDRVNSTTPQLPTPK
jgi:hypothetical protein